MKSFNQLTDAQKEAIGDWEDENNITGDFECQDNFRYANPENQEEMHEYEDIKDGGCCGSHDVELKCSDGTVLWYGFNYGH